jgi:hypothetical protein
VYRVEGDQMEGAEPDERAWVQLVFLHGPEGEERELLFRREITPAGSSEYSINGKVVTWDAYDARLQKFGILVKTRNFLVFQVCSTLLAVLLFLFCFIIFNCSQSLFTSYARRETWRALRPSRPRSLRP